MSITEQQALDLVGATTALKTTFETKDADITAAVATVTGDAAAIASARTDAENDATSIAGTKATVDSQAADIATAIADINAAIDPKLPITNMLRDAGKFFDDSVAVNDRLRGAALFDVGGFLTSYNGSVITEHSEFIDNNSTHGGGAGALDTVVSDLMTAMGRAGNAARYGVEFAVAQVAAGSGTTALLSDGHYLMTGLHSSIAAMTGVSLGLSGGYWIRSLDDTIIVRDFFGILYIDGVEHNGDYTLTPVKGWTHVAESRSATYGYISSPLPTIYGKPSVSKALIACAVVLPNTFQIPIHTSPVTR